MGMDRKVSFPPQDLPPWTQVADGLAKRGLTIQLRMIDGELTLPNEIPPHDWRELRVSTAAGMITLRRETDGVTLVIWGNADEKLQQTSAALADALKDLTKS